MRIGVIFLGGFLWHGQNYTRNGVVKFQVDWRLFGACNDRLYKGLGFKYRSKGYFVIIFEIAGAWL